MTDIQKTWDSQPNSPFDSAIIQNVLATAGRSRRLRAIILAVVCFNVAACTVFIGWRAAVAGWDAVIGMWPALAFQVVAIGFLIAVVRRRIETGRRYQNLTQPVTGALGRSLDETVDSINQTKLVLGGFFPAALILVTLAVWLLVESGAMRQQDAVSFALLTGAVLVINVLFGLYRYYQVLRPRREELQHMLNTFTGAEN